MRVLPFVVFLGMMLIVATGRGMADGQDGAVDVAAQVDLGLRGGRLCVIPDHAGRPLVGAGSSAMTAAPLFFRLCL